jgi:hypothetical protein
MGLPESYLLVYPLRDERELAVTAGLLDAAIDGTSAPGARGTAHP